MDHRFTAIIRLKAPLSELLGSRERRTTKRVAHCVRFFLFPCLGGMNGSTAGLEAADLSRGPHQASEAGTKSRQNKAGVTAKGDVFVGVSKEAGWSVASDSSKGRHSLCCPWV